MKYFCRGTALLLALCLLLAGCGTVSPDREPVQALQCTQPAALPGILPAGGTQAVVCWSDYEQDRTTVQIVDMAADAVDSERILDGAWELADQIFSDGRLALYSRETNTWRFLSASLADLGTMEAENMDGVFSDDAAAYYFLSDYVLCRRSVEDGAFERVALSPDLRLLDIVAFDAASGRMVVQFFLSAYSSECGTAILDMTTGQCTMLQKERYQAAFSGEGICLLSFDADVMGYTALYGSGDSFFSADAGIFRGAGASDLYAISGTSYLMGVGDGGSILYHMGEQITACPLTDCGMAGEMYAVHFLPDAGVLAGAVYADGGCRLYVMDPAQLPFSAVADAAPADSPLAVDDTLAQTYWAENAGVPVAESLQEARQYADTLETRYGVRILLSSQCSDAAALCDRAITLTDTMGTDEELGAVNTALDVLARILTLYPDGFLAQFQNSMGEGGIRFLLVEAIASDYGAVGCTYESGEWQNIALDVRMADSLDSIICHEIWHATENHILSQDYAAFLPDDWDALNPAGFSYYQDATKIDAAQKWTLYSGSLADVCFVDSYACVDQREDRARIMEYFMVHEDEAKLLIQSPVIRQKLQWMCSAVRSSFDTAGWGAVRWESLL